jgi:hypothetical protein
MIALHISAPIADCRITGCVRFVHSPSAKVTNLFPHDFRVALAHAKLGSALRELLAVTVEELLAFPSTHSLSNDACFFPRKSADLADEAHDLLLVKNDAQSVFKIGFH